MLTEINDVGEEVSNEKQTELVEKAASDHPLGKKRTGGKRREKELDNLFSKEYNKGKIFKGFFYILQNA